MTLRRRTQHTSDQERGATAIMVAASLLLLMGLAAVAVDSGILFGDRRQQASAADVGALAAVQFAKTSPPATHPDCTVLTDSEDVSACRGAEEALAVIDGTLPGRYPDAEWDACVDPEDDTLGYTQDSFISDCISFTSNLQRARVVLPGTDVDTSFAKALGFGSASVGAFAEAGLDLDIIGGVRPFAIGPSGAGTSHACFAAGDTHNLDAAPCGSGNSGNYGKLDVFLYGNETYPTREICTGSNAERMTTTIVAGSDHPMVPYDGISPIVHEQDNCANIANPVNQFEVATGNAPGAVDNGFFDGSDAPPDLEGILLCKGSTVPSADTSREDYPLATYESLECTSILNTHPEDIDHTPLWRYINPGANSEALGGGCDPGAWANKGRDKMETCLENWKAWVPIKGAHTVSLFTKDVVTSPRFMAIPILDKDPSNGNSVKYHITEFRPVYLETLYLGCGANTCSIVHSPGESSTGSCPAILTSSDWSCGWPGNGNKVLEAASAFVFTLDMLPSEIAEKFPFQEGTIVYNLFK